MRRGDVWWANLPLPAGRRPVLLLSRNAAYSVRTSVTVATITRSIREIPVEVVVDESDGMPVRSVINLDDILTIPKSLVEQRLTSLSPDKMTLVNRAIVFALALEEL